MKKEKNEDYVFTYQDSLKKEEEMLLKNEVCEYCNNTGYYGDNGPGVRGNTEYMRCDMCSSHQYNTEPPAQNFAKTLSNFKFYLKSIVEKDPCAAWNGNTSGNLYVVDGAVLDKFLADVEQTFEEETAEVDYENVHIDHPPGKTVKGIFKMSPEDSPLELSEEDQEKFAKALLDPPLPSSPFVKAFKKYNEGTFSEYDLEEDED